MNVLGRSHLKALGILNLSTFGVEQTVVVVDQDKELCLSHAEQPKRSLVLGKGHPL